MNNIGLDSLTLKFLTSVLLFFNRNKAIFTKFKGNPGLASVAWVIEKVRTDGGGGGGAASAQIF